MMENIQGNKDNFKSHLFHFGLIKKFIVKELSRRKNTWGSFLEKLGYELMPPIALKVNDIPSSEGFKATTLKMKHRFEEAKFKLPSEIPLMTNEQPAAKRIRGKGLTFNIVKGKECTQTQNKYTLPQSSNTDEKLARLSKNEWKSVGASSNKENKVGSEILSEGKVDDRAVG